MAYGWTFLSFIIVVICKQCLYGFYYEPSKYAADLQLFLDFCPGADLCSSSNLTSRSDVVFPTGKRSCCQDCSCDNDCELNDSCCFANSSFVMKQLTPTMDCLPPVTPLDQYWPGIRLYMVNASIKNGQIDYSCASKQVALWGSFYPVYSKSADEIFVNSACAIENGWTDFKLFQVNLTCSGEEIAAFRDFTIYFSFLLSRTIPLTCHIFFQYPGGFSNIRSKECYQQMVTKCDNFFYTPPDGYNLTRNKIIDLCHNGPHIYFYPLYKNVFCYMCSSSFDDMRMCESSLLVKSYFYDEFTYLLNFEFLSSVAYNNEHSNGNGIVWAVWARNGSREFRPILCPSGQHRDIDGHCKHLLSEWYIPSCDINVRLTPHPEYEEFFQEMLLNGTFVKDDLHSSMLANDGWKIFLVYSYRMGNLTSLAVHLFSLSPEPSPALLLPSIKRSLLSQWFYKHKQHYIYFKAEMMPFSELSLNSTTIKIAIPQWLKQFNGSVTNQISNVNLKIVIPPFQRKPATLPITYMLFCEQIQLKQEEFILYKASRMIYYKPTGNYLFENEHIYFEDSVGQEHVHVCLEDTNFQRFYDNGFSLRFYKTWKGFLYWFILLIVTCQII